MYRIGDSLYGSSESDITPYVNYTELKIKDLIKKKKSPTKYIFINQNKYPQVFNGMTSICISSSEKPALDVNCVKLLLGMQT